MEKIKECGFTWFHSFIRPDDETTLSTYILSLYYTNTHIHMCVYIKILMMGFIKVISFTGNSLNSFFTRFILILFLLIIIVLLHFRWLFNFLAVFRFLHVHRFEFCLFCPSPVNCGYFLCNQTGFIIADGLLYVVIIMAQRAIKMAWSSVNVHILYVCTRIILIHWLKPGGYIEFCANQRGGHSLTN